MDNTCSIFSLDILFSVAFAVQVFLFLEIAQPSFSQISQLWSVLYPDPVNCLQQVQRGSAVCVQYIDV